MNKAAKVAAVIVMTFVLGLSAWAATSALDNLAEVQGIAVAGDITQEQELAVYGELAQMNIAESDLRLVRDELERIEWIERVSAEKDWPDTLRVTVVARDAMALWNDRDYLDMEGLVFDSPFVPAERLPQLYGPEGSERQVMKQYHQLSRMLNRYQQRIDTLELSTMGSWRFRNDAGIAVELGKDDVHERLQRFVQVINTTELASRQQDIFSVDTRYPNGVAVAWKSNNRVATAESYNQGRN